MLGWVVYHNLMCILEGSHKSFSLYIDYYNFLFGMIMIMSHHYTSSIIRTLI